jgi:hypothetical protein
MKKNESLFVCLDCKKEFVMQNGCLSRRRQKVGEPICKDCYKCYSKGGRYDSSYYPEEIRGMLNQDFFYYDEIKHLLPTLRTKKKVKFKCQECNKDDIMVINSMHLRKICGIKPICKSCSLRYATNSEEWIENNSKAQLIAQNRPEVKEKQRQAQLRLMAEDPLYVEKRCSKSYISGTIRGFRFDSSWELYYLAYCWESEDVLDIQRYEGNIKYRDLDDKERRYYPDFVVTTKSGVKRVVEIKGSKKYNNFHEKFNAARKMFGFGYLVIEERDLIDMGIKFRRESWLKGFYKKYYSEITFYNNKKIRKFKVRIKEWLK